MKILLPRCLGHAALAASTDNGRYAMTHLKVIATESGFRLEATDGKRLLIAQGEQAGDPDEYDLPTFNAYLPPGEVLVDATAFREFCRPSKGEPSWAKDKPVLLASCELGQVLLRKPGQERLLPLAEGRFPSVDQVLPKKAPLVRFKLRADVLIGLLQAAQGVCQEKELTVEFLWYGRNQPVGLAAQGAGILCDMLQMPMV